ncbi:MAG: YkvA family protein [Ignavibacteria bacterium]
MTKFQNYIGQPESAEIDYEDLKEDLLNEYYPESELSEDEAYQLAGKVDKKMHRNKNKLNFLNHIKALRNYLFDKNVKWYRKSVVIAALLYFITPIDSLPDFTPLVGFLDDLGVIAWTIKFLGDEIRNYYS